MGKPIAITVPIIYMMKNTEYLSARLVWTKTRCIDICQEITRNVLIFRLIMNIKLLENKCRNSCKLGIAVLTWAETVVILDVENSKDRCVELYV